MCTNGPFSSSSTQLHSPALRLALHELCAAPDVPKERNPGGLKLGVVTAPKSCYVP